MFYSWRFINLEKGLLSDCKVGGTPNHSFWSLWNFNLHLTKAKLKVKAKHMLATWNMWLLAKGVQCPLKYPGANFSISMSFTPSPPPEKSAYSLWVVWARLGKKQHLFSISLPTQGFSVLQHSKNPKHIPLSVKEIILSLPRDFSTAGRIDPHPNAP